MFALTANGTVSTCSFLFLLLALASLGRGKPSWRRHVHAVRWVLLAFCVHFTFVLASFLLRPGEVLGTLEKPSRMLFAVSALFCVLAWRPNRNSLWFGVMGGVLAGAVFIAYQRWYLHIERPGGLINAITYGDLALCMSFFSLAALVDWRDAAYARWRWLALLAALAGLVASFATGSRGGWIALLAALFLFMRYGSTLRMRSIRAISLLTLALLVVAYLVPQTGVRDRIDVGMTDIKVYANGGVADTSLGIRFELWKAAAQLIEQRPLLGHGIVSYRAELDRMVKEGKVSAVVQQVPHLHNDILQVLVTGGVLGALAWLATLVTPLVFFLSVLRRHASAGNAEVALALAGALLVLSYGIFGLTEVIFWSMRGSLFYVLMMYLLMGLCLNQKEFADGN